MSAQADLTKRAGPVEVHAISGSMTDATALPESIVGPIGEIDSYTRSYVERVTHPAELREAVEYSLLGPGKRVRPLLVWHSASAGGGVARDALPAATAIEMVHAFSLVHDDLPGMDDDDLRRGRPTLHRHTSEGMAILAGDAMLTLAFRCLVDQVADEARGAKLVAELSSGTSAMITGQVYDTYGIDHTGDPAERLDLIHRNKTGALIRCACRMGAMFAPEPDDVLDALTAYGDVIGLMFQIVDDLLDVTQTTDHLGKRSGKDIDSGKLTYPGVYGVERSKEKVRQLHQEAIDHLSKMGAEAEPLRTLASYMAVRTR